MKSVLDQMKENQSERKIADFRVKQQQDYSFKKAYAITRIWEFYNHPDISGNYYVAVGGLDSITLECIRRWESSVCLPLWVRMASGGRNPWREFGDEELDTIIPAIYGEILRDADGTLRTTQAQRTGCSMCGFGIHLEKRPHRFDRLYQTNPKEWEYQMYHIGQDIHGNEIGWGHVLDYIGVGWRPEEIELDQISLFGDT